LSIVKYSKNTAHLLTIRQIADTVRLLFVHPAQGAGGQAVAGSSHLSAAVASSAWGDLLSGGVGKSYGWIAVFATQKCGMPVPIFGNIIPQEGIEGR